MIIHLHQQFKKSYKKRIFQNPKLIIQTKNRINLFKINPTNPILKDHHLLGKKSDVRSFSIGGDLRILYKQISDKEIIFFDIGTHNQVY